MFLRKKNRALTLIEAMLLLVIMSIVAVAAGVGFQAVAKVPASADDTLALNAVIVSVMEQTKANLIKNWPTSTWGGSNYSITAGPTGYTPTAGTTIGASPGSATGYSTPASGSSPAPLSINNKTWQLNISLDKADPALGTSYKTDFLQLTVKIFSVSGGVADTSAPRTMVTYVAQP